MKKFLTKLVEFFSFSLLGITILIVFSKLVTSACFNSKINADTNIILLGNSHIQNSINDKNIPNAINLGRGGSTYFYDYLKLKDLKEKNPQIDTLILGYSPPDLEPKMDSWITSADKLKFKLREHFHLMNLQDYFFLLSTNPIEVMIQTPQTIFYNVLTLKAGISGLGGFQKLERFKLSEALENLENEPVPLVSNGFSKYQLEYLSKIYDYCIEKDIKLILLGTPIRKEEVALFKDYQSFYKNHVSEEFPAATLLDDAKFKLPDDHYADLDHINYLGAEVYTKYLKEKLFK